MKTLAVIQWRRIIRWLIVINLIVVMTCLCGERRQAKADPNPNLSLPLVCGLLVIGIGVVVVLEMVKVCKKMDQQQNEKPDEPPATNQLKHVQFNPAVTNRAMTLSDASVTYRDCSAFGMSDPVSGNLITGHMQGTIQSSTDLANWSEEYSFEGWSSQDGVMLLWSKGGVPAMTNYCPMFGAEAVPLSIGNLSQGSKFFRMVTN